MLLSTLACAYQRKPLRSNTETDLTPEKRLELISPIEWALIIFISAGAATLAWRCATPGTGRFSKAVFAALFSEFYLLQATARWIIGDYRCDSERYAMVQGQ